MAAGAGCSARSLPLGFRRYRGTTPLAFIRAARVVLDTGLSSTTFTEVALRYAFTNPGRFAEQFRQTFGVSPDEVPRRAGR